MRVDMRITDGMARAFGLAQEDSRLVSDLVAEWREHYDRNKLRDAYYYGHVPVKDLGVSVTPKLMRRLRPHVDWAAKCVDWWTDRVQFDGITVDDEAAQASIENVFAMNDAKNMLHKVESVALRHSCAFLAVTHDDEVGTVISGYPATAASAIWDERRKRIKAGMVVVESDKIRGSETRYPRLVYVFTDENLIILERHRGYPWVATYEPHGMGRCPMEPIAYHATLERPFGVSRITGTVMALVDDAQREMANMTAAAAFSAAPQKYILNADKSTAEKIKGSPFEAFIGSIITLTQGKNGQTPQFGQLTQLSMQPHTDYMRNLAAQFSGATGVPLSSLGVVSDNPSSAEAIYAGKEDAVVDIQAFIDSCKRSVANVALMALADVENASFGYEMSRGLTIDVHYHKPDRPSISSQSDAMMKQISAIPWLAESEVALRELGYDDEQIHQLMSDKAKANGTKVLQTILGGANDTQVAATPVDQGDQQPEQVDASAAGNGAE